MMKRIELEIISSLSNIMGVAMMQSNDGGIRYMNQSAMKLFGFSSIADFKSYPRSHLFADSDTYQVILTKLQTVGKIYKERILFNTRNNSHFWGSLYSVRKLVDGELINDEIILDISSEIKMEHLIVEKNYLLEKVRRELDRFVYSASHDLRSPISTMTGLVNLMKMKSNESNEEYIGMMSKCLSKLEAHIAKLVEFGKINNERIAYQKIDVEKIIMEVHDELQRHSNYDKAILTIKSTGDHSIYSDPSRIKTCLRQLLMNAYDYLDVEKRKSSIDFRIVYGSENIQFEIIDNGIGIRKDQLDHIFTLFYRGTVLSQGSGLGLYLVKEALIKLNGIIRVESELNEGTSIFISLPTLREE